MGDWIGRMQRMERLSPSKEERSILFEILGDRQFESLNDLETFQFAQVRVRIRTMAPSTKRWIDELRNLGATPAELLQAVYELKCGSLRTAIDPEAALRLVRNPDLPRPSADNGPQSLSCGQPCFRCAGAGAIIDMRRGMYRCPSCGGSGFE